MEIVILGAGGRLGREVVAVLVKREHKVCAVVRRSPDPLFDSAVEVRLADAQSKQQILSAISGFDAVVNVIMACQYIRKAVFISSRRTR